MVGPVVEDHGAVDAPHRAINSHVSHPLPHNEVFTYSLHFFLEVGRSETAVPANFRGELDHGANSLGRRGFLAGSKPAALQFLKEVVVDKRRGKLCVVEFCASRGSITILMDIAPRRFSSTQN